MNVHVAFRDFLAFSPYCVPYASINSDISVEIIQHSSGSHPGQDASTTTNPYPSCHSRTKWPESLREGRNPIHLGHRCTASCSQWRQACNAWSERVCNRPKSWSGVDPLSLLVQSRLVADRNDAPAHDVPPWARQSSGDRLTVLSTRYISVSTLYLRNSIAKQDNSQVLVKYVPVAQL